MSKRRSTVPGFKACRNCKYVVQEDAPQCPNCGSTDFTTTWSGLVVVLDAERSCVAKRLGIERPGMYAIEIKE